MIISLISCQEVEQTTKTTEQKHKEQSAQDGVLSKVYNGLQENTILTILPCVQIMEEKKTKPHLFNLNFDPQLSGRLVHIFQKENTEIGNTKGKESDICMVGPG